MLANITQLQSGNPLNVTTTSTYNGVSGRSGPRSCQTDTRPVAAPYWPMATCRIFAPLCAPRPPFSAAISIRSPRASATCPAMLSTDRDSQMSISHSEDNKDHPIDGAGAPHRLLRSVEPPPTSAIQRCLQPDRRPVLLDRFPPHARLSEMQAPHVNYSSRRGSNSKQRSPKAPSMMFFEVAFVSPSIDEQSPTYALGLDQ
jgi:hypothetical protein